MGNFESTPQLDENGEPVVGGGGSAKASREKLSSGRKTPTNKRSMQSLNRLNADNESAGAKNTLAEPNVNNEKNLRLSADNVTDTSVPTAASNKKTTTGKLSSSKEMGEWTASHFL